MLWLDAGSGHSRAQIMNRRLLSILGIIVLLMPLLSSLLTDANNPDTSEPAWSSGTIKAIKRVSSQIGAQHEPMYLSNLDCNLLDYRMVGSGTMQTGCFSETAYGLFDSDSGKVIFTGTDEALPLLPYAPGQILAPWPKALNLVSLSNVNTGGVLLGIYKNPLNVTSDVRSPLGQLTGKQLTAPADLVVRDAAGQPLVLNPLTLAFSDNGSWLVAETLTGSFVRINLTTLKQVPFAPSYGSQGSPALLRSQVAISDDGHFVAISNYAAGTFKVYNLVNCTAGNNSCPSYDYQAFAGQQIGGLKSIQHVRFVNRGLISFEAQTTNLATGGVYLLAPSVSISSLIDYLGLGDSYTSGEGAFDYLSGTDLANNKCHLSAKSYPLLLTRDLFSPLGGRSVACSGAVIRDVASTSDNYRGQIRDGPTFTQLSESEPALLSSVMTNFVPGYVAQQRFVGQYQPRIMTVSVGGNDIGFGAILKKCVIPHLSIHLSDNTCYNTYEDRLELTRLIDRTTTKWTSLYRQLLKTAPGSSVYAVGYPSIAVDNGNCGRNVHLNKSELEFSQEAIAYLNLAIAKAAKAAGVSYVDISQALAGHRLCETAGYNVAVNGLTAGKDSGILDLKLFGNESYHPNALGHELIEQAILKQTNNLTRHVAATPTTLPASKLLDAPKSGRIVQIKIPGPGLVPAVVTRGKSVTVNTSSSFSGFKANTLYKVRLDGPSGLVLDTVTSDINGDILASVGMPSTVTTGGHTIDVTGENQLGESVAVTQPVYVPAGDEDSDGDGIDDTGDSCPGAVNSAFDEDSDGVDDTCDGIIGQPVTVSSAGPTGTSGASGASNTTPVSIAAAPDTLAYAVEAGNSYLSTPFTLSSSAKIIATLTSTPRSGPQSRANSQGMSGKQLVATDYRAPKQSAQSLSKLPRVNWLPWAVLAVLFWLLMLLTAILRSGSTVQYAHGRP